MRRPFDVRKKVSTEPGQLQLLSMFVVAVLCAVIGIAGNANARQQQVRCEGSIALLNDDVPPTTSQANHNVEHTAAIHFDGQRVGWLYENHSRQTWFQLAPDLHISKEAKRSLLGAFGVSLNMEPAQVVQVTEPPKLSALPGHKLEIVTCY